MVLYAYSDCLLGLELALSVQLQGVARVSGAVGRARAVEHLTHINHDLRLGCECSVGEGGAVTWHGVGAALT